MSAACDLDEIRRAARFVRTFDVDLDDLVSEAAVCWLERARSNPDKVAAHPGKTIEWALRDAVRRLTGSRRAGRLTVVPLEDRDVAAVSSEGPSEDDITLDQVEEWRRLPRRERLERVAESEAALGSSPTAAGVPIRSARNGAIAGGWRVRGASR